MILPDQDPDAADAGAGKHHGKHHSSETQQQGYGGYSIESQQGQQGQGYDKPGYGQQQGSYDRPVSGGYGQPDSTYGQQQQGCKFSELVRANLVSLHRAASAISDD